MGKCVICSKECESECCSGACRAKKSRRTQERTPQARTVTAHDVSGHEYPIDYEGRRKDWALLESWAKGKGTPQQERIGKLSMQYDVLKGYRHKKTNKATDQGYRYLGLKEKAA